MSVIQSNEPQRFDPTALMVTRLSVAWSGLYNALAALAEIDPRGARAVLDQVLREAARLRAEGDDDVQ